MKLSDGFNGADLRNVCTEAGMFAIRDERDYVIQEDFMKAARLDICFFNLILFLDFFIYLLLWESALLFINTFLQESC